MNNVILTDCDGCLLNWVAGFDDWMHRNGYRKTRDDHYGIDVCYNIEKAESKKLIKTFNESSAIGFLGPYKDAIQYVRKLHAEHGFVFHVITSLSHEYASQELRTANLKRIFGQGPFTRFVYLGTGDDKHGALDEYKDSNLVWVEDKPENAIVGFERGLDTYLMTSPYNEGTFLPSGITRVKNWRELSERIVG